LLRPWIAPREGGRPRPPHRPDLERGLEALAPRGLALEPLSSKVFPNGREGPSPVRERLKRAGKDELERWADRILDARTLEDVFGE